MFKLTAALALVASLAGLAAAVPTTVRLDEAAIAAVCGKTSCPRGYQCELVSGAVSCRPKAFGNCSCTGSAPTSGTGKCKDNLTYNYAACGKKFSSGKYATTCSWISTKCPTTCDAKACGARPPYYPIAATGKLPPMTCSYDWTSAKCTWQLTGSNSTSFFRAAEDMTPTQVELPTEVAEPATTTDAGDASEVEPTETAPAEGPQETEAADEVLPEVAATPTCTATTCPTEGYKCTIVKGMAKAQCIPQSHAKSSCPTKSKPAVKSPKCADGVFQSAAICVGTFPFSSTGKTTYAWVTAKCPPAKTATGCDAKACGAAPQVYPCANGSMPVQKCQYSPSINKCTWFTDARC